MGTIKDIHLTEERIVDAMEALDHVDACREKSLVMTKLEEAQMWLHRAGRQYAPPPVNEASD